MHTQSIFITIEKNIRIKVLLGCVKYSIIDMRKYLILSILFLLPFASFAQENSEFASWVYLSAGKKLSDRWSVAGQTEVRTGKTPSGMYLWYFDMSGRYNLTKWLVASTGADYIRIQSRASGAWMTDWRPFVSIIPSWTMGPLRANVNLCYSYNFFTQDSGRNYHLMRYRFHVEYPIPDSRFIPFVRFELRHKPDKLERVRGTFGTSFKVSPRFSIDAAYIHQKMYKGVETNAISLGYKLRL